MASMRKFWEKGGSTSRRKNFCTVRRSESEFSLEPIEPRLLLSADLVYSMAGAANDLLLRLQKVEGIDTVQLVNRTDQSVLVSQTLADTSGAYITGSDGNDRLTVDFTNPFGDLLIRFADSSHTDIDSLETIGRDKDWVFDEAGAGKMGPISYEGIEQIMDETGEMTDIQRFFLSTGGAFDVDYEGPVSVEDIDVPKFTAPDSLAGEESTILLGMLDILNNTFADLGAEFTLERPIGSDYSTIYLGGDGSQFAEWGNYFGLAQQVDVGNVDREDIAFVFSDQMNASGLSVDEYAEELAGYVGHEAGHLLGYAHAHKETGGVLDAVAFDPKVHVAIGNDAVEDALDDGMVTINGKDYAVHPRILLALQQQRPFYNAGAVGPDGFPDSIMGQFVLHAEEHATFLARMLDMAWQAQGDNTYTPTEQLQILAFAYGYLTHSTADHWAHTLVNQFTEGVAPGFVAAGTSVPGDQRDLGNMLRHFMTEGYIVDALEGVDTNPNRTEMTPGGDVTDDTTPGIEFDAPIRFIYETLIRAFPADPTHIVEMDWAKGTLTADAATKTFTRSEVGLVLDGFVHDGFKIGQKITVAGFSNLLNNGTFLVTGVTDTTLTVNGTLADETASGDEEIVVHIPKTPVTTINVNANAGTFTRTSGSFLDEGFAPGMRFSAFGFNAHFDNFIVESVTATTLKVVGKLSAGDEVGSGNEQLVVQGKRGPIIDSLYKLRDKIYTAAVALGDRGTDFGTLISNLVDKVVNGDSIPDQLEADLFKAYLYQWADAIDDGVRHWGEFGLAFTKAMFDPQSRRDLQNKIGAEFGADTLNNTARANAENAVSFLKVLIAELDDPNGDGNTEDSFITNHLLAMAGVPPQLGLVLTSIRSFASQIDAVISDQDTPFNPTQANSTDTEEHKQSWLKDLFKKRWGIDYETFDFLKNLAAKMDAKSITIGSTIIPLFKPGDHERMDAYLGLTANHHQPAPPDAGGTSAVEFYGTPSGVLKDDAHFNKQTFAAYANSVTLTKMMFLMEQPVDGETTGAGELSNLFSDLASVGGPPVTYDFTKLNMHGAHGGNILTATLPGVAGTEPWLGTIDADQVWRQDNYTTTSALFRISYNNDAASPAIYEKTGLAAGEYKVYATWLANVTQKLDNQENSNFPDKNISPAQFAQYKILDGVDIEATITKDQRQFAGDFEHEGMGFSLLGTYTIDNGTLRVELNNLSGTGDNVVAGPILVVPTGGTAFRIQNDRNSSTLIPIPGNGYSDNSAYWTDLVYESGGGNNPLWESELSREGFRAVFDDWINDGSDFPDLADSTSSDPNNIPIAKNQLPSFATPFGAPFTSTHLSIPIPQSLETLLISSLNDVVGFAQSLESSAPLNIVLPLVDKSLAKLLDISGNIDRSLRKPIVDYFTADATPTFQELFDVIKATTGGRLDSIDPVLEFDVDLRKTFSVDDLKLALGAKATDVGLELDGTLDLTATIAFVDEILNNLPTFTFGINLDPNPASPLSLDDRVYLKAERALLSADIDASDLDFGARFGFLGVGVENGTAELHADVTLNFNDPNDDGRITMTEIGNTALGTLVTANYTGTLTGGFPIVVKALPGFGNPNVGQVTFGATDLFDLNTYDIHFVGDFSNVFNFANIDSASLVGLLGQLTFWLDEFRNSDEFAKFDLPLVGPALDRVLGFADTFRDALLFDDGDDGVDGPNTLQYDVNAALEDADLGAQLRAEFDNTGKIVLIANQPNVAFTVNGANSTAGTHGFHTYTVPGVQPESGVLLADLSLLISVSGSPAIAVMVQNAQTSNNLKRGNDRRKLVDGGNSPTFTTVHELISRLAEVLDVSDPLTYNPSDDTLTWTLDLGGTFGQKDFPIDFALPGLPSFLQLQAGGLVRLVADGDLNLTLGVYLGDAPSSTLLDGTELLTQLNGGVDISTDLRITGKNEVRTVYGQLSADAHFDVIIGNDAPVPVTVAKAATNTNTSVANLVDDINAALAAQGLSTKIVAIADGLRVTLQKAAGASLNAFGLTASSSDAAVKDIGFAVSQNAAIGPLKILAASDLSAMGGKLTQDAHFSITVDGVLPAVDITVTKAATENNTLAADLVADINAALAAQGLSTKIVAVLEGQRVALQKVEAAALTSFSLAAAAGDKAVTELGFGTAQSAVTGPLQLAAEKELAALRGRLTGNASFSITSNTLNGGAANVINILAADTATNRYAFDIVNDINAQLDKIAGIKFDHDSNANTAPVNRIQVGYSGGKLTFTAIDGATTFSINAVAGNTAVTELGLPAGIPTATALTFYITTRGGGEPYGITLDGLTSLGQLLGVGGAIYKSNTEHGDRSDQPARNRPRVNGQQQRIGDVCR